MKTETIKDTFKPFTITIETEAEAKILWNRLNMGRYTSPEEYYKEKNQIDRFL